MDVGGQAVINGVMMRDSEKYVVAVDNGNQIVVKHSDIEQRVGILKWPFIRGIVALCDSLKIGMSALEWSSRQAGDEPLSKKEVGISFVFAILMSIILFVLIPFFIASLFAGQGILFSLIDGLLRIGVLVGYIFVIGLFEDIKEIFRYHGAEHKAVHCLESGEETTVENARKYPTLHRRCGTSFLMIVMLISILLFSILGFDIWYKRIMARILLIPVVAGISYEVLKLSSKSDNLLIRIFTAPGLWIQKLTTAEPSDTQLAVGIRAINELRPR